MNTQLVAINAKYIHTNLAVRLLYTYTKADYDINYVEYTIKDSLDRIVNELTSKAIGLIGFSCYIWNIEFIKKIVKKIKSISPTTKILLGGPEVSYDIKHWFNIIPIDYIISGEGEVPFKALLNVLNENQTLEHVPQLHYKKAGKIFSNHQEVMVDLNSLPSPYRIPQDIKLLPTRIQYIESSRGCPYHCSYCLASLEKKVRFFDRDTIKEELIYLMNHGARVFKFLDRTFNVRKEYALDMFQFIIEYHKPNSVFQFEITGELLDEQIIHYLNQHAPKNLFRFEIGIQSTNDLTNQLVLRNQNFNKLRRNIELIQKGDVIDLHLDLIAGLPKENYSSFIKTFNDVFALRPLELQLGFLKMLRGTKLRNETELYHYKFHEEAPYEVISNQDISEAEISRVHAAEDILEKYYNSHRFDSSTTYIIKTYYQNNNYLFFEKFGVYYKKHYQPIGYQLHDLFLRLLHFLETENIDPTYIIDLLKYDYLQQAKTKPKIWFKTTVTKKERLPLYEYIMNHLDLEVNLDYLFRYALIEKCQINPQTYEIGSFYLLKFFSKNNKSIHIFKKNNQL